MKIRWITVSQGTKDLLFIQGHFIVLVSVRSPSKTLHHVVSIKRTHPPYVVRTPGWTDLDQFSNLHMTRLDETELDTNALTHASLCVGVLTFRQEVEDSYSWRQRFLVKYEVVFSYNSWDVLMTSLMMNWNMIPLSDQCVQSVALSSLMWTHSQEQLAACVWVCVCLCVVVGGNSKNPFCYFRW